MKIFSVVIFCLLLFHPTGGHPQGDTSSIHAQGNTKYFTALPIDTTEKEVTVATSVDGQVVLTYKDEKGIGNLYVTRLYDNQWTRPEKLNTITNNGEWEPDECISTDGNTLYFTSRRSGGFGGKDIYRSKKLTDGEWGKAVNLGPVINSPYDEEAPFIYPGGTTLFFTSNRYNSHCCFDIFTSRLKNNGAWTMPVYTGYPAKTPKDDLLYASLSENKKGNTSSLKEITIDGTDNYMITFHNPTEVPFALLKGRVVDISEKACDSVKIIVTDNETGKISGIYYSNDKTGQYAFILPAGRNNNLTYEGKGYLFQTRNRDISSGNNYYEIHTPVQMPPFLKGSGIVLHNVFFDSASAALRKLSNVELNSLFRLLTLNPKMIVELSASMDSRENSKSNVLLLQERMNSVAKFLVAKGIDKNRIITKGNVKFIKHSTSGKPDTNNQLQEAKIPQRIELKIVETG